MISVFKDKRRTVFILFITAIILVVLNVIGTILLPSPVEEPELKEINSEEVDARFRNAILSYGFEEKWIVPAKSSAEVKKYTVKVPKDVPIALLIKEIRDSYTPAEADILVEEKKINGNNYLQIFSNDHLRLTSEFVYNKEIFRPTGYAGTLIMDLDKSGEDELKKILLTPQLFGVVLTPSKSSAALSRRILAERKELIILLNDDIKELEFKLGSNFSEKRLKDVLRTIIGTFPKAVFYIIDSGSSLYNSPAGKFIINEFTRRNMRVLGSDIYLTYDKSSDASFAEVLKATQDKGKLIAIPAENYSSLYPEFDRLRKIGFKFVNPSAVFN